MGITGYLEGALPYPEEAIREYVAKGWWLNLTYGDLLDRAAQRNPDKLAVIDERVRLTYMGLRRKVDRLAIAFLNLGIGRYDRILFQLPNRHEFVVAYYAAQRIGAVPVLAVARQEYQEISNLLRSTEAVAWILPLRDGNRDYTPLIDQIRPEAKSLKHLIMPGDEGPLPDGALSFDQLIEETTPAEHPADYLAQFRPDPNDVAMIVTTGGTTGLPKGVPRTHNSFHASIRYTNRSCTEDDVFGLVTPIGHTMAHQGAVGSAIFFGGTLVIVAVPRAKEILEAIQKWRITSIGLVPTQLEDIMNFPDLSHYDITSLKRVVTAGAALKPETADKARETLAGIGAQFKGGEFGSSEGPCAGPAFAGESVPRGSVGVPKCEGDRWKAIDEEERTLPPGAEGELVAKGPCVFTGYYKSEAENGSIFTRDGYYKMGDLGRLDEKGNIFITGRKKDIIQRGGEGIIPKQIEDLLDRLDAVEKAAVVGMPDPRLGERACAYVVLKEGATLTFDEMVQSLKERGAGVLLLPERLEIVDDLPKTGVGKIDKKELVRAITEKLKSEDAVA
jgi:2,3-dihydroxybenzoate-AMP ligase